MEIIGDRGSAHNIIISNKQGKELTLDFQGDKLKVFGDLKYDEAAKIFFDSLSSYFEDLIEQKVKERIQNV